MFFSSTNRESKKSDKFEKLSPPTSKRKKKLAIQHILLKLQKKEYKRHDYQKLNDTYLDDN